MNLELIHHFGQNYPEYLEGTLDYIGVSTVCQFNRRGTLLAVGCNDGKVLVWDFLTREVAKCLTCHTWPICCLCWSRDSHLLLTGCADNTVCCWQVLSGDCLQQYRFTFPMQRICFAPRDSSVILVVPVKQMPILIWRDRNEENHALSPDNNVPDSSLMAGFDRRGNYLFIVAVGGKVYVTDVKTRKLMHCLHVTGMSASCVTKQIEFARRGSSILISGSDRVIRIVDTIDLLNEGGETEVCPRQRLQDLINKTQWRKCCFSGDGEYVCASSAKQHNIYIWEKESGSLVQILSGAKGETIIDIAWHPIHPIIVTVANGVVSIWSQDHENWSGLVPNFRELEDNVEYEERESEFDDEDEDKSVSSKKSSNENDDVSVDICTVNNVSAFLSSDEEFEDPNQLVYISTIPEIDDPEDRNTESMDSYNGDSLDSDDPNIMSDLSRPYKRSAGTSTKSDSPPAPLASKDISLTSADAKVDETSPSLIARISPVDIPQAEAPLKRKASATLTGCKTRSNGSSSSATLGYGPDNTGQKKDTTSESKR